MLICSKVGHIAAACWQKFDQSFKSSTPHAYIATPQVFTDQNWYPGTGATIHITSDLNYLDLHSEPYNGSDQVQVGNRQGLNIFYTSSSLLYSFSKALFLNNILYVIEIKKNLLSVHQFTKDNNVYFEFYPSLFDVKDPSSDTILLQGKRDNGLYPLHALSLVSNFLITYVGERVFVAQWHARLGHLSLHYQCCPSQAPTCYHKE